MSPSALEGLVGGVLGEPATGPGAAAAAAELERLLAELPPAARVGVGVAARALDLAALPLTGSRLRAASPQRAGALLEALASRALLAPSLDGLKALVLVAGGATAAGEVAAAPEHPAARPDPPLAVTPAAQWPDRCTVEAVVIGSGAGGAVAARTLARAGLNVVVVEEGRRFSVDEFRSQTPRERFTALYRDAGTTAAIGRPPVMLPLGRGVGGTTLINSGTCFRTPQAVVRRWYEQAGFAIAEPNAFDVLLDEVWRMLDVAPSPAAVLGANARVVLDGAARLGWDATPLQRNAPGCGGCCQCAVGCPRNAKAGVHMNALPDACEAGARILSEARVERIVIEHGRAAGMIARRRDGTELRIAAPLVLVAAGATETPPLLRRSGCGGHPQLGRNLALHPALNVAGRFAEPVVAWRGVLQSVGIERFLDEGILLEATAMPPGLGSLGLPGWGPELRRELVGSSHLASLGAMVADAPSGRVYGRRRAVITYRLARADGARLLRAAELAGRVLLAAGATELLTGVPHAPRVRTETELRDALATADVRRLHLAAFHPTGTARAGNDPVSYPVDPEGRLRGVAGVWLCDASILPSCPRVNPQVSIMAVAMGVAQRAAVEINGTPPATTAMAPSHPADVASAA